MHTYVVFADEKSIEYIPKEGFAFLIPAPNIEERPGGPGLDDIRHLLDREDRDESFEFQPTTKPPGRLIGGRITHTGMLFIVPSTFSFTNVKKIVCYSQRLFYISRTRVDCAKQGTNERILKMAWLPQTGTYRGVNE